eukprot:TRINITY_DN15907_c0_g1_i2.p1 TRINITY_DN15907_c0_g1~~TRINITY_DN15907_c0_g1_i2.p1  ORF type:complete len:456 (+),score=137.62 TRINITY_DN15907_c0_g1_i2:212-1579(+)
MTAAPASTSPTAAPLALPASSPHPDARMPQPRAFADCSAAAAPDPIPLTVRPLAHTLPPPIALPKGFRTLVFAADSLSLSRGVTDDGVPLAPPPLRRRGGGGGEGPRPAYPLICLAALRKAGYKGAAKVISKPGLGLADWARDADKRNTTVAAQVAAAGADAGGVVVQLGVNDMYHGISPAVFLSLYGALVRELRCRLPRAAIVLVTVTPSLAANPQATGEWQQTVNAGVAELAAQVRGIVADAHWALLSLWRERGREWEYVLADRVHPTSEGQARIGHAVAAALLSVHRHYSVAMLCEDETRWLGWRLRPAWKNPRDCAGNPRVVVTLLPNSSLRLSLPVQVEVSPPWEHAFSQLPTYGSYAMAVQMPDGRVLTEKVNGAMGAPSVWWRLPVGAVSATASLEKKYSKRTNYGNRLLPVPHRRTGEDPPRAPSAAKELAAASALLAALPELRGDA